jgi:hypothetical protein
MYSKIILTDAMLKQDIEGSKRRTKIKLIYLILNIYAYLYENAGEFKQPGSAILNIGMFLYQDTQP